MVIIRLSLYAILLSCLFWCLMFFGGPWIIKNAIIQFSNNKIIPAKISMTPTLDVSIGRIDFIFASNTANQVRTGFSRAVDFSWSIFDEQPFFKIKTGFTKISNGVEFESFVITTPSISGFKIRRLPLKAKVYNITGGQVGTAKSIEINLKNVSLLDDIHSQDLTMGLVASEVSNEVFNFHTPELIGQLKYHDGIDYFDLKTHNMLTPILNGAINNIIFTGSFEKHGSNAPLSLVIADASFMEENLLFEDLQLDIFYELNKSEVILSGKFSVEDIELNQLFLGNLPMSEFSLDFSLDNQLGSFVSDVEVEFGIQDRSEITGIAQMTGDLNISGRRSLLELIESRLSGLQVDYFLSVGEETIYGTTKCVIPPCNLDNLSHRLATSNTVKIFQDLNALTFLNPMVLAYLYSFFLSGQPTDQGHVLDL